MCRFPVWINGVQEDLLPVSDRGLAYGDGIFETILISGGRLTLADYHWQRLSYSCDLLGIVMSIETLLDEVNAFLLANPIVHAVLKVIVTRGSGGRGYNPAGCHATRRILSLHALPERSPNPAVHGAKVKLCQMRLGRSAFAGLKHLNRLEQVMARKEWKDEFDEGLLCDYEDNLIEGTMSNLFIVTHDGCLVTPDLSYCGVAGVCRNFIIEFARKQKIVVKEKRLFRNLNDAMEIFLCNSVNGVWPVTEYEGVKWDIGSLTTDIRNCVLEKLNG